MNKTLTKPKLEPREHAGQVIDYETKQPIAGATITVRRTRSKTDEVIRSTTHVADSNGEYSFDITTADLEHRIYLEFDIEHGDYAPMLGGGYSYEMLMTNEAVGQAPFFARYPLRSADKIKGRAIDENREALSGVKIHGFAMLGEDSQGSLSNVVSGPDGSFEFNLCKGSTGHICLDFENHAVREIILTCSQPRDLGDIRLSPGVDIEVRVVDSKGEPVSGIQVACEDVAAGKLCGEFARTHVRRAATTNDSGEVVLRNVLPGEQSLSVWNKRKVDCPNFFGQTVEVKSTSTRQTFEFRAEPTVLLSGRSVNSKGEPRSGHLPTFSIETADGRGMLVETFKKSKGEFCALMPESATQVDISVITDQHTAFLMKFGDVLTSETFIHEMKGVTGKEAYDDLTITWFDTTLLLLKIVDESGNEVPVGCTGYYPDRIGHVNFNYQKNPQRYRSCSIIPDLELTLHIEIYGDGDLPERVVKKSVVLTEGETREMTIEV